MDPLLNIICLKRKLSNAETEIKISIYMENFQSSGMHHLEEL
jgi:hypothetical protein